MKVFVSGKLGEEAKVRRFNAQLLGRGHELSLDWTELPHLRPYARNRTLANEVATREAQSVASSDVLILLADRDGKGMYVELGIALGLGIPVIVLTDDDESTMFYQHSLVTVAATIEEVFDELEILSAG